MYNSYASNPSLIELFDNNYYVGTVFFFFLEVSPFNIFLNNRQCYERVKDESNSSFSHEGAREFLFFFLIRYRLSYHIR